MATDRVEQKFIGQDHCRLFTWLSQTWLKEGSPVCFIQGFSGIGKTELARLLVKECDRTAVMVKMPEGGINPVQDLLYDLAQELSADGETEMAEALDSGKPLHLSLVAVLRKPVLIVIDEFQRSFEEGSGKPLAALEEIFDRIANRPNLIGRVLLLTNQSVDRGRWSEPHEIRSLSGLTEAEAEAFLEGWLLKERKANEISPDRRRDVVKWLGCNPRALRVLVESLRNDSLDALIGLNPESWELRDRQVSPELLQELEKRLLERTLGYLSEDTLSFLQMLSVHRKAVKKEALEGIVAGDKTRMVANRDELLNRFLMERYSNRFNLNPIVREIALQRVKANPSMLKAAHSKAADHYTRHFTAKQIVGGGKLGGYFVEARYHLAQSDRDGDLVTIIGSFEKHMRETIAENPSIPQNPEELNERISVLSALLDSPGAKALEYHLARLLVSRGTPADLRRALIHAQRATSDKAPVSNWTFRVDLEFRIYGINRALEVGKEGIQRLAVDKGLFSLYEQCATLLAQADRIPAAIDLLHEGIRRIPGDKGVVVLYERCATLLADNHQVDDAIKLLKEGIQKLPSDKGVVVLYERCATLLADNHQVDDAIKLLKEGIRDLPSDKGVFTLYERCGKLLAQAGRTNEAIKLLEEGIRSLPANKGVVVLYERCATLLADSNRVNEAITLLKQGIRNLPLDKGVFTLYERCGKLLAQQGQVNEAIDLIQQGTQRIPFNKGVNSLYASGAKILARSNRLLEAIQFLKIGIRAIPLAIWNRKLIEQALLLCLTSQKQALLKDVLSSMGNNEACALLGQVFQLQMQGRWQEAAQVAHQGATNFPTYRVLIAQEAFSWLCAGNPQAAADAMKKTDWQGRSDKKSNDWLRALIAFKLGDNAATTEHLAHYLERPLQPHEVLSLDLFLYLWDTSPSFEDDANIAFYFPVLPPSLTGLEAPIVRLQAGSPILSNHFHHLEKEQPSKIDNNASDPAQAAPHNRTPSINGEEADSLSYRDEDQPWFVAEFPKTREIEEAEARSLHNEIDVVIITATEVELNAVMNLLKPYPQKRGVLLAYIGSETYYLGKFGEYRAVVTKCRMGAIGEGSVILATQEAQRIWHPRAIIMVGIAFGKNPEKQKIADVLIASQIISYEQQRFGQRVEQRGAITPSNTTLLNRFENIQGWRFTRPDGSLTKIYVGPILSGEKLIDDPEFKAALFHQFPQAIGGEMEGAGLCAASNRMGTAWILVKSICDWGDGKKHKKHQPLAAAAAVSLVHHVLSQRTVLNSIEKQRQI